MRKKRSAFCAVFKMLFFPAGCFRPFKKAVLKRSFPHAPAHDLIFIVSALDLPNGGAGAGLSLGDNDDSLQTGGELSACGLNSGRRLDIIYLIGAFLPECGKAPECRSGKEKARCGQMPAGPGALSLRRKNGRVSDAGSRSCFADPADVAAERRPLERNTQRPAGRKSRGGRRDMERGNGSHVYHQKIQPDFGYYRKASQSETL